MAAGLSVDLDRWRREFDELMLRVGGRFARVEPRRRMAAFVRGLLAGLPRVVTERAEEILKDLEERGVNIIRPPKRPRASKVRTALSENPAQLGLFRNS